MTRFNKILSSINIITLLFVSLLLYYVLIIIESFEISELFVLIIFLWKALIILGVFLNLFNLPSK